MLQYKNAWSGFLQRSELPSFISFPFLGAVILPGCRFPSEPVYWSRSSPETAAGVTAPSGTCQIDGECSELEAVMFLPFDVNLKCKAPSHALKTERLHLRTNMQHVGGLPSAVKCFENVSSVKISFEVQSINPDASSSSIYSSENGSFGAKRIYQESSKCGMDPTEIKNKLWLVNIK